MDEKELHAVEAHEDERLETHETEPLVVELDVDPADVLTPFTAASEPQLDEIRGGYYAGMNRAFPSKAEESKTELYDQDNVQCLHHYEHIEACRDCGDAFLVIDDVPYEANHPEVRTR